MELRQIIHTFLKTLPPVIFQFPEFFAPVELGKIGHCPWKTVVLALFACVSKRFTQVGSQPRLCVKKSSTRPNKNKTKDHPSNQQSASSAHKHSNYQASPKLNLIYHKIFVKQFENNPDGELRFRGIFDLDSIPC